MEALILDQELRKRLIRQRRRSGSDRFDEVWNGVYVMSPLADNLHQDIAFELAFAIRQTIGGPESGKVNTGINVSDQAEHGKRNYRCPDVAVFLPGNPARNLGTHWLGGPDFAVEVISKYDRSRLKLPFYAKVGVREVLLVDRSPWALELYRSHDETMELVGTSTSETSTLLSSLVLPLAYRLLPGTPNPRIEVVRNGGNQTWLI
jgi:Uma2 family endonuclease